MRAKDRFDIVVVVPPLAILVFLECMRHDRNAAISDMELEPTIPWGWKQLGIEIIWLSSDL
jgi:hypothetical protein